MSPWEAFAYKGILVVQVPDVHDAKRKILLTIAALKSIERWRKAGFRINAPFPLFQHNAQCKGAGNKAAASSASRTAQVKSRQVIFFFFFFVAAVYWANLKGAFMTCAARNAPNPQIPRTDEEKNPPPEEALCEFSRCGRLLAAICCLAPFTRGDISRLKKV